MKFLPSERFFGISIALCVVLSSCGDLGPRFGGASLLPEPDPAVNPPALEPSELKIDFPLQGAFSSAEQITARGRLLGSKTVEELWVGDQQAQASTSNYESWELPLNLASGENNFDIRVKFEGEDIQTLGQLSLEQGNIPNRWGEGERIASVQATALSAEDGMLYVYDDALSRLVEVKLEGGDRRVISPVANTLSMDYHAPSKSLWLLQQILGNEVLVRYEIGNGQTDVVPVDVGGASDILIDPAGEQLLVLLQSGVMGVALDGTSSAMIAENLEDLGPAFALNLSGAMPALIYGGEDSEAFRLDFVDLSNGMASAYFQQEDFAELSAGEMLAFGNRSQTLFVADQLNDEIKVLDLAGRENVLVPNATGITREPKGLSAQQDSEILFWGNRLGQIYAVDTKTGDWVLVSKTVGS